MAHLNPIAVYNYKGGVGKSTVTTALADLAAQQFPTCAVDCDPQCTTSFYMLGGGAEDDRDWNHQTSF